MVINDTVNRQKLSLVEKIEQAECDINNRRQRVKELTFLLKQDARQKLLSPSALITYAGVGLGVGLLVRRPSCPKPSNSPQSRKLETASSALVRAEQLLGKILKIVALGRALATLLPKPSTQSNQPAHNAHHQQYPQARNEGAPH